MKGKLSPVAEEIGSPQKVEVLPNDLGANSNDASSSSTPSIEAAAAAAAATTAAALDVAKVKLFKSAEKLSLTAAEVLTTKEITGANIIRIIKAKMEEEIILEGLTDADTKTEQLRGRAKSEFGILLQPRIDAENELNQRVDTLHEAQKKLTAVESILRGEEKVLTIKTKLVQKANKDKKEANNIALMAADEKTAKEEVAHAKQEVASAKEEVDSAKKEVDSAKNEVDSANNDVNSANNDVERLIKAAIHDLDKIFYLSLTDEFLDNSGDELSESLSGETLENSKDEAPRQVTTDAIITDIIIASEFCQIFGEMRPNKFLIQEGKNKEGGIMVKAKKVFLADNHQSFEMAIEMRKLITRPLMEIFQNSLLEIEIENNLEIKLRKTAELNKKIEILQKYLEKSNAALLFESQRTKGELRSWFRPDIIQGNQNTRAIFLRSVVQAGLGVVFSSLSQYAAFTFTEKIIKKACKTFFKSETMLESANMTASDTMSASDTMPASDTMSASDNMSASDTMPASDTMSLQEIQNITENVFTNQHKNIVANLCVNINDFLEDNKESLPGWSKKDFKEHMIEYLRVNILKNMTGPNSEINDKIYEAYGGHLTLLIEHEHILASQENLDSALFNSDGKPHEIVYGLEGVMAGIRGLVSPLVDSYVEKDKSNKNYEEDVHAKTQIFLKRIATIKFGEKVFLENLPKQAFVGMSTLAILSLFTLVSSREVNIKESELILNILLAPLSNSVIDALRDEYKWKGENKELNSQAFKVVGRTSMRYATLIVKHLWENEGTISTEAYKKIGFMTAGGFLKEVIGAIAQYLAKGRCLDSKIGRAAILEKDVFQLLQKELDTLKTNYKLNKLDEKSIKRMHILEYILFCYKELPKTIEIEKRYYNTMNREFSNSMPNNCNAEGVPPDVSAGNKLVLEHNYITALNIKHDVPNATQQSAQNNEGMIALTVSTVLPNPISRPLELIFDPSEQKSPTTTNAKNNSNVKL
jgi:hypothetical protein